MLESQRVLNFSPLPLSSCVSGKTYKSMCVRVSSEADARRFRLSSKQSHGLCVLLGACLYRHGKHSRHRGLLQTIQSPRNEPPNCSSRVDFDFVCNRVANNQEHFHRGINAFIRMIDLVLGSFP